jgi:DNA-binding PadR family transcriptional regulator
MKKLKGKQLEILKREILQKMYSQAVWEKGHVLEDTIAHAVRRDQRGSVYYALKELVKEGLVKVYGQSRHGTAYQLNIEKKADIEAALGIEEILRKE